MTVVEPIKSCELPIHRAMAAVLRGLTLLAAMLIVAGGVLWLRWHGDAPAAFHPFSGVPASLRSVPQITAGAFHGHPLALVQLGILLLIATPVLRVLFVGIGYLIERDWLYVTVAGIVLGVLVASLAGHKL